MLALCVLPSACTKRTTQERSSSSEVETVAPDAPNDRPRSRGRLFVLGFDGADPRWVRDWAAQGELPVIQGLIDREQGRGFHTLTSTNPPQSPVAWTSFATGTLPGDHGIFDFIARTHNASPSGMPVLLKVATSSFDVPADGPPIARNLRTGAAFWQTLSYQGVRVAALNVPYSFPPDPMQNGRILSGLGVPDLRETNSTFTYVGTEVTADERAHPPGGGVLVPLMMQAGVGHFDLEGPSLPHKPGARMKLRAAVRVGKDPNTLQVSFGSSTNTLPLRRWSDWIEIVFAGDGSEVHGILRVMPLEAGKRTRLFISPISFDPRQPYSPISHPRAFSRQIAAELGHVYKTVGWDHDTSALNAELVDEAAFLADMQAIEQDRKAMLLRELQRDDYDLLIWVSTAPDRASHMFYRLRDPQHPRYDAALAQRYGDTILHEYQRMDATIGEALARLRPDDTLIVMSDHGFHDYRRGLHVNQWLRSQGWLQLKGAASSAEREFLLDVDWSRTRAYAVGTGQIYLNVRGRERDGIVAPEDVAALTEQIKARLVQLRDRERSDAVVVTHAYTAAEAFRGKREGDAPDLQIGFAENYRTSWETILGGVPEGLFADNDKKWSGDHAASDFADTPGFILANRAIDKADPHIVDIAATAHALFQRPIPAHYVGKPLFSR